MLRACGEGHCWMRLVGEHVSITLPENHLSNSQKMALRTRQSQGRSSLNRETWETSWVSHQRETVRLKDVYLSSRAWYAHWNGKCNLLSWRDRQKTLKIGDILLSMYTTHVFFLKSQEGYTVHSWYPWVQQPTPGCVMLHYNCCWLEAVGTEGWLWNLSFSIHRFWCP